MFKLLFSTAMIAPVLLFALQGEMSGGELIDDASATQFASAAFTPLSSPECHSETIAVVFHDELIDTHSAEALGDAMTERVGCETSFVRMTSLISEDADALELQAANRRRAELAAHIEALIGEADAQSLPIHSEFQSSAASQPILHHALLRVERRPAQQSEQPAFASTASSTVTLN